MAKTEREAFLEEIYGEIAHNVNPVIGWNTYDAYQMGAGKLEEKDLKPTEPYMRKAAEAILQLIESKQEEKESSDDDAMYRRLGYTWSEETQTWMP